MAKCKDTVWVVTFAQLPDSSILNSFRSLDDVLQYYSQYKWKPDAYDESVWNSNGSLTALEVDLYGKV